MINELVKNVAELRQSLLLLEKEKGDSYKKWAEANLVLLTELVDAKEKLVEAEELLRGEALTIFWDTGNKNPAPEVQIKIFRKLDYDPVLAQNWALEHKVALSLDKKVFEKIANVQPMAFIKILEEPKVLIAQDLNKLLEENPTFQEREACKSQNDLK